MDRSQFYHTVVVDDVSELDLMWNSLSKFVMNYNPLYYRVTSADLMRPDIISYRCYGVVDFWWIILLVNDIENAFTDLYEGQILKIPHRLDIYDFQKINKIEE